MARELGHRERAPRSAMRLSWSHAALNDLAELRAYIARDKPRAAAGVARRILHAVNHLEQYPRMGRSGRVEGTRELVVSNTLIWWRIVSRARPLFCCASCMAHGSGRLDFEEGAIAQLHDSARLLEDHQVLLGKSGLFRRPRGVG